MQIILCGGAAGYEAEHTARLFFPAADRADTVPETGDFVAVCSQKKRILSCCIWTAKATGAPLCAMPTPMPNMRCAVCCTPFCAM